MRVNGDNGLLTLVAGGWVYWMEGWPDGGVSLMTALPDGGASRTLETGALDWFSDATVDGSWLYLLEPYLVGGQSGYQVKRVPLDGGAPELLYRQTTGVGWDIGSVVVDQGQAIDWASDPIQNAAIDLDAVSVDGGTPVTLEDDPTSESDLFLQDGLPYWLEQGGTIAAYSPTGGAVSTLWTQPGAQDLWVDDAGLYFAASGTQTLSTQLEGICFLGFDAGAPVALVGSLPGDAGEIGNPVAITTDETSLYFMNGTGFGAGAIYVLTPK